MFRMAFFAAMLLLASGYAMWRGGAPERAVGAAMLSAYVATLFSHSAFASRFAQVEVGVLIIDVMLMAILITVALKADHGDRKTVVYGKSRAVRVDPGGRRIIKNKNQQNK